jgi:hypothetical protein
MTNTIISGALNQTMETQVTLPDIYESVTDEQAPSSGSWTGTRTVPMVDGSPGYTVSWNLSCTTDCVRQ